MSGCDDCRLEPGDEAQVSTLKLLLLLNAAMFVVEAAAGWMAQSSSLLADSLDMLADASVYALALRAVGRGAAAKVRTATWCGVLQLLLTVLAASDVARRAAFGSEPEAFTMLGVGGLALLVNVTCLVLLSRHRRSEVHMRATWICSRSDVLANLAVLAGALLVAGTGSRYPDLVVGAVIVAVVFHGAVSILREAARARRDAATD
ncbi:MAG: cation transporter [Planctomycetota bacterium]|nr:MAG: cation transporter [Planctomycetota bacterium]